MINGHWDGYGIGHWDWNGNWDNGRGQWALGWEWKGMGQWDPSHSQRYGRQVYTPQFYNYTCFFCNFLTNTLLNIFF